MDRVSLEETKRIINKIFKQANAGRIEIDSTDSKYNGPWRYFGKFFAKVGGNLLKNGEDIFSSAKNPTTVSEEDFKVPTIIIPDTDAFALLIQEYLNVAEEFYISDKGRFSLFDEGYREKLVLDLFTNTTNFDRHNILSYIQARTNMLKHLLQTGHFLINTTLDYTIKTCVQKNPSMLEGPYRFTTYFSCESEDKFYLPSITFGIIDNTVYIYAIQARKDKQTSPIAKKLDRHFRKVNKDVDMEDIIGQVSPNALVALTIFLSSMQKEGIKTVVAPNFMPLRYFTNLSGEENYFNKTQKGILQETSLEEIVEKHNRNQHNITNKFTYTLLRYCHHFDGCEFNFDSIKEQSTISLSKDNTPQDNLINEVDKLCTHSLGLRDNTKQK